MQSKALGRSGLQIMPVVLGGNVFGWTIDEADSFRVLDAFVDHGFDTIDTADYYSAWAKGHSGGESETILGRWFESRPAVRNKVKLCTKVGLPMGGPGEGGLSEDWIIRGVDKSLQRLKTDWIDVYFAHSPDPVTSQAETLTAFEKLRDAGKIRAIGASNYGPGLLREAVDAAADLGLSGFQVLQPEYNLYDQAEFDGALRDLCIAQSIGVISYFSLASGFLSGKYRSADDQQGRVRGGAVGKYLNARGLHLLDVLDDVAANHRAKPAEVALAWIMAQDGVTAPIASATNAAQVESFATAASLNLSAEDIARLTQAGRGPQAE